MMRPSPDARLKDLLGLTCCRNRYLAAATYRLFSTGPWPMSADISRRSMARLRSKVRLAVMLILNGRGNHIYLVTGQRRLLRSYRSSRGTGVAQQHDALGTSKRRKIM